MPNLIPAVRVMQKHSIGTVTFVRTLTLSLSMVTTTIIARLHLANNFPALQRQIDNTLQNCKFR